MYKLIDFKAGQIIEYTSGHNSLGHTLYGIPSFTCVQQERPIRTHTKSIQEQIAVILGSVACPDCQLQAAISHVITELKR